MSELEKLAEGREAELFLLPDGRLLRLMRPELKDPARTVELEATALRAAAAAGAPVPELYELVDRDGRPGLVMERLEGSDLLTLVGRRPWRIGAVARRCGRLHAALHRVAGPAELPPLPDLLRGVLGSDAIPRPLRDEAVGALDDLPEGDRLCHGDFHPGNVVGDRVIDWGAATRGDPIADVARSWVLLEFSPLPPGAPRTMRALAAAGRGFLLRGYMNAYRRAAEVDHERFARWIRVIATARLAEEVEGEREAILARLASSL